MEIISLTKQIYLPLQFPIPDFLHFCADNMCQGGVQIRAETVVASSEFESTGAKTANFSNLKVLKCILQQLLVFSLKLMGDKIHMGLSTNNVRI